MPIDFGIRIPIFSKPDESALVTKVTKSLNELCEHLRHLGVTATVLDRGLPEVKELLDAIEGRAYIKIEGRNLDLIKGDHMYVQESDFGRGSGGTKSQCFYNYVLRGKVDATHTFQRARANWLMPQTLDYLAEGKSIKKGFIRKEVVDYRWEGRELAQLLNADSNLKNMLMKERVGDMWIAYKHDGIVEYVEIGPFIGYWLEKKSFPTRDAFEAYDRIAYHIRSIMKAKKTGGKGE